MMITIKGVGMHNDTWINSVQLFDFRFQIYDRRRSVRNSRFSICDFFCRVRPATEARSSTTITPIVPAAIFPRELCTRKGIVYPERGPPADCAELIKPRFIATRFNPSGSVEASGDKATTANVIRTPAKIQPRLPLAEIEDSPNRSGRVR